MLPTLKKLGSILVSACMYIHCSTDLKEHRTIFSYIAVLNTPKFTLKTINNDPECPLLLYNLNNASKSLTSRNLIQEMSCPSPWNIFAFFENIEV